ncbi:MAG: plastocyanin/azurin family copper-binding protein [Pseudomonadota bacterium]
MHPLKNHILAVLSLAVCAAPASAADIQIKLTDKSATEGMLVFEPGFVKADVDDTLVFTNISPGHNSHSLLVPPGAQPWQSPFDKEFRVKLEKEGIYLYGCDAHKRMGMVGVVQVGRAVNMDEARQKASEESSAMLMNKDRFAKALDKVQ